MNIKQIEIEFTDQAEVEFRTLWNFLRWSEELLMFRDVLIVIIFGDGTIVWLDRESKE